MKSRTGRKKALETGKAIALAEAIEYAEKSVVSRALVDKKAGTLTLFAFDKDEGLSEHTSPYDAVVHVLEGRAELIIGGRSVLAAAGGLVIMPANVPHALRAKSRFKMLLTMIRDKGA
ncbi:MAG: cupin domain-containing protein [Lentisphaerae bacterium]|jgi:quercetin dioxygenase-like cupin family protein|nr:cupin domain-containing protein [Lentisphaerota bacterium]